MSEASIKVGLIADRTGPLSFAGVANANVARMVIDDINASGGLLGRTVELIIEDSETSDVVAGARAAKLVQQDRVDLVIGGIYSSTRLAIKEQAVTRGRTLYIYPEQYEGDEADPLIFCTGPTPAQQVDLLIPWLMRETGVRKFFMPSSDYIWPRVLNRKVREILAAEGGSVVGEEYAPMDQTDFRGLVKHIIASGADVVFNTIVPPGLAPFMAELHAAGFTKRGGRLVCTYFDEDFLGMVPAEHVEGLYGCLDYYQDVRDPFSEQLLARYNERFPGTAAFTAGGGCTGIYRGLLLWAAAVSEAGTLRQDAVLRALDHARIPQGPGGGAEMAPGQHHLQLNMYIAQATRGRLKVIKNLGHIAPKERLVASAA